MILHRVLCGSGSWCFRPDLFYLQSGGRSNMCRWRVALPSLKSVDMADTRTRYKEQLAATLPDLHKEIIKIHGECYSKPFQMMCVRSFSLTVYKQDSSMSTLYDISKFSPPHICSPGSYRPSSKKKSLSMAKRPPAMAGDLQV